MAAYLADIRRRCSAPGCLSTATHELRNTYNAPIAPFCANHADKALKDFLAKGGQ